MSCEADLFLQTKSYDKTILGNNNLVVCLETGLETQLRRNAGREDKVPETIIDSMLSKLAVPEIHEARCVQCLCV